MCIKKTRFQTCRMRQASCILSDSCIVVKSLASLRPPKGDYIEGDSVVIEWLLYQLSIKEDRIPSEHTSY